MGVKDLWQILAPTCHVVSIKELSGTRVAVDASIWIISSLYYTKTGPSKSRYKNQFLYTIIKKILILLESGIIPIFVFDGKTPDIKRRELMRRIQSQNDPKRLAKIMAKSLMNKILDKKISLDGKENSKEGNQEGAEESVFLDMGDISMEKFWEIIESMGQEENLEKEIIGECMALLKEQNMISDISKFQNSNYSTIYDFMSAAQEDMASKLQEKYKDRFAEIESSNRNDSRPLENLKEILLGFEANQTLKQIHNNFKDKLIASKTENVVSEVDGNIKIDQFGVKIHSKFESNTDREFVLLKNFDGDLKNRMKLEEVKPKIKKGKTARQKRFDDIMKSFNNVRTEALQTRFSCRQNFTAHSLICEKAELVDCEEESQEEEMCLQTDDKRTEPVAMRLETINAGFDFDSLLQNERDADGQFSPVNEKIDTYGVSYAHVYRSSYSQPIDANEIKINLPENEIHRDPHPSMSQPELQPIPIAISRFSFDRRSNRYSIEEEYNVSKISNPGPIETKIENEGAGRIPEQQLENTESNIPEDDQINFLNKNKLQRRRHKPQTLSNPMRYNPRSFPSFAGESDIHVEKIDDESFLVKHETISIIKYILRLLGLKYVDAEEEAEAQCAYLEMRNIVGYTITEDSDSFLFGGKRVIRNFGKFTKGKDNLEICDMQTVEDRLGLNRNKLILLGLLLGCDYCEGVRGIGVVNAMEIISAFDSIAEFSKYLKSWGVLPDSLNQRTEELLKKASDCQKEFYETHKNYKKHWLFPDTFPSRKVIKAFEEPKVVSELPENDLINIDKFQAEKFRKLLEENLDLEEEKLANIIRRIETSLDNLRATKITNFFKIVAGKKRYDIKSNRMMNVIHAMRKEKVPVGEQAKLTKRIKRTNK